MSGKKHKTIGEQHAVTRTLITMLEDHMNGTEDGELLSYEKLNAACGMDVQADARGYLQTARRVMLREHNAVFGTVSGKGLRMAHGSGKTDVADMFLLKSRRAAKRGQRTLGALTPDEYEDLDRNEKRRWNAKMSVAGLVLMTTSRAAGKRLLEAGADEKPKEIPVAAAIDAIMGRKKSD